jgi:hypothetical protein
MKTPRPSFETFAGLYAAALSQGPLAVARVVESAERWGYSVRDVVAAGLRLVGAAAPVGNFEP